MLIEKKTVHIEQIANGKTTTGGAKEISLEQPGSHTGTIERLHFEFKGATTKIYLTDGLVSFNNEDLKEFLRMVLAELEADQSCE